MNKYLQLEDVCCGVCGADIFHPYASGYDYEYHTSANLFHMVECQVCDNVYLNPRPVQEELSAIYPPNYYAYNYDSTIHPIAIRAKGWLDSLKIREWRRNLKTSMPRFLDVGCGDGRYLKMMHKLGIPKSCLYGVELDADQVNKLNQDGFNGFFGRIEDVAKDLPNESFDLIVLLQVLEHVSDPRTMVSTLSNLLRKGGVLIIETPNTSSIDVRLFKASYWGGYHFPRHWNLMNQRTLARLAHEQGLRVEYFNFLPSHSFWIFSFHHLIWDKWKMKWLANLFNPFRNLFLLAFFTGFDLLRARLGFQTSNIQLVALKS